MWEKFRQVPFRKKISEGPEMLVKIVTHEDTSLSFGAFFYGIVVSKKLGNAVCRNRMKRRVREAFRLIFHDIFKITSLEKGKIFVTSCFVLLKEKALANLPFISIVQQLSTHLSFFFPSLVHKNISI